MSAIPKKRLRFFYETKEERKIRLSWQTCRKSTIFKNVIGLNGLHCNVSRRTLNVTKGLGISLVGLEMLRIFLEGPINVIREAFLIVTRGT